MYLGFCHGLEMHTEDEKMHTEDKKMHTDAHGCTRERMHTASKNTHGRIHTECTWKISRLRSHSKIHTGMHTDTHGYTRKHLFDTKNVHAFETRMHTGIACAFFFEPIC